MIGRLARLTRLRLSLMNGVAAVGGCCLFTSGRGVAAMLSAAVGVSLLAMGGAAFNQVLERDIDTLMERTRLRPLPRGEMRLAEAVAIGGGLVLAGCMALALAGGALPVLLGLAALVWYLAVYTPLKRRTPLALPLGALCGAVPPLIGWCLAGGRPADFRIMVLAGLFYLWQVPHFWLLQRRYADDYRRAGIPLFAVRPGVFGVWLAALTAAALMLPAFGIIGRQAAYCYALLPLILLAMAVFRRSQPLGVCLNLYPALVTLALFMPG